MCSINTIKVTNNCCLHSTFSANISCGLRSRLKLTMSSRLLAHTTNSEWTFWVRNLLKLHIQKAIILLSALNGRQHAPITFGSAINNNLLGEHKIYALENQVILQSSHLLLFLFFFLLLLKALFVCATEKYTQFSMKYL